jgi:hypothetical protein
MSLNAQIKAAERQVSIRQQQVGVRAARLARQLDRDISAPSSLLLAAGIGFVSGELTRRQAPPAQSANPPPAPQPSVLQTTLNLFASAYHLYAALPVAWTTQFWLQVRNVSASATEQPPQTATQQSSL